jgi:hypothetical protein
MRLIPTGLTLSALLLSLSITAPARADSTEARCDIYPKGQDQASSVQLCDFSQRQGYIGITLADGSHYGFNPKGDQPGNYVDQDGRPVTRETDGGDDGLVFRTAKDSVFVYWDTAGIPENDNGQSAGSPYSTADYNATAQLSCSFDSARLDQDCPAGVQRGVQGSASVRIMKPNGDERIFNFDGDRVSTPNGGHLRSKRVEDEWQLHIGKHEYYSIPEAFLYGD